MMNQTADGAAMGRIEAVIFDMDGLLLDSEALSMEAAQAAGEELGYPMPHAFCHSLVGNSVDRCRVLLHAQHGVGFPTNHYLEAQDRHMQALVAAGRLALKAGVLPLLDRIDALGLPAAVATSSPRARALHHLAEVGILDRFRAVVARDDVANGKPDPEPYLHAASLLGIPAAACLALEDSHTGVRAAHAAGMRVIMVPDLLSPDEEMRSKTWRVADSLHAVLDALDAA